MYVTNWFARDSYTDRMVFYVCHELDKAKTPNNFPFCQYESRTKHLYSQLQIATRKASWNPAGVEPVHWKQADIDPGSLKWAKIGEYISSELMVRIKQNRVYGVETPLPRSFLGGVAQTLEIISKTLTTYQNSAHEIYDYYQVRTWY